MAHVFERPIRQASVLLLTLCLPAPAQNAPDLNQQVAELRALVERLQTRVVELESRLKVETVAQKPPPAPAPPTPAAPPDPLGGTTLNFLVDTYYSYNFNAPI